MLSNFPMNLKLKKKLFKNKERRRSSNRKQQHPKALSAKSTDGPERWIHSLEYDFYECVSLNFKQLTYTLILTIQCVCKLGYVYLRTEQVHLILRTYRLPFCHQGCLKCKHSKWKYNSTPLFWLEIFCQKVYEANLSYWSIFQDRRVKSFPCSFLCH